LNPSLSTPELYRADTKKRKEEEMKERDKRDVLVFLDIKFLFI
jgi:hypothetical protein